MNDPAIWTGSTITGLGLIFAFAQAALERRRRLRLEANDRTVQRQAQAQLISAWLGQAEAARGDTGSRTALHLLNTSNEPVYGLVVSIVFIQGAGPRSIEAMLATVLASNPRPTQPFTTVPILPPGNWRVWLRGSGHTDILSGRGAVEVAFTDRANTAWIRRAMGPIEEIARQPTDYLRAQGLVGPYDWQHPEPDYSLLRRPRVV